MRLIALMLVRNEDWIIRTSLDAALRWCDGVVVVLDRCSDATMKYVHEHLKGQRKPCLMHVHEGNDDWNEMDLRQLSLELGRKLKGTHFAIVDADEILTHNLLGDIRGYFFDLPKPGTLLELPMVAVWDTPAQHRLGDPTWSNAWLTLGFKDKPDLTWKPAQDGYHHHHRPPYGVEEERRRPVPKAFGGVMHLQFANPRRLVAKHVLYRMVDHIRWPGRDTIEQLNWKYDQALKPTGHVDWMPDSWWGDYRQSLIDVDGIPYQESRIVDMLNKHGREAFAGLDLKGF